MSTSNNFHYWLKLQDDFFDREEIRLIESQKNGKDYIIFYLKLLLKSIKNDGKLYFRNSVPYSPEMLANLTGMNIDTVRVAVDIFIKFGMMQRWDDGTLYMIEAQNMIGKESKWAKIKRNQRAKNKEIGQCPMDVQQLSNDKNIGHCPTDVQTKSNECPTDVLMMSNESPMGVQTKSNECPADVPMSSKINPQKEQEVQIDILSQQNSDIKGNNKAQITEEEVNRWLSEGGLK